MKIKKVSKSCDSPKRIRKYNLWVAGPAHILCATEFLFQSQRLNDAFTLLQPLREKKVCICKITPSIFVDFCQLWQIKFSWRLFLPLKIFHDFIKEDAQNGPYLNIRYLYIVGKVLTSRSRIYMGFRL